MPDLVVISGSEQDFAQPHCDAHFDEYFERICPSHCVRPELPKLTWRVTPVVILGVTQERHY